MTPLTGSVSTNTQTRVVTIYDQMAIVLGDFIFVRGKNHDSFKPW